jgi:hypothetical protein
VTKSTQQFPTDPLSELANLVVRERPFTNTDVLRAIEYVAGRSMPTILRDLINKASFKGLKRRGHPTVFGAAQDFAIADLEEEYRELLKKYRDESKQRKSDARISGAKLPKGEDSPSDRALKELMGKYRKELGVKTVESLRNMLSNRKMGRLYHYDDKPEPFEFKEWIAMHGRNPDSSS